jgi:hypothetical protein
VTERGRERESETLGGGCRGDVRTLAGCGVVAQSLLSYLANRKEPLEPKATTRACARASLTATTGLHQVQSRVAAHLDACLTFRR